MPKATSARDPETDYVPEAPLETIQQLERENEALRRELWKHKRKPTGKIGYILLFSGLIALIWSIVYASYVPAFIGISLTFWGALLLFVRPAKYVKASLLESTVISTFANINKIVADMKYEGKGIYLPPKYFKGFRGGKVFIPTKEEITVPPIEEIAQEKVFLENPKGICLTPSGLDLTNMFEDELGTEFAKAGLEFLQDNLPQLFIEGLEIAEDFEMRKRKDNIHVKISSSIYNDFCSRARRLTKKACSSFACPLCSSVACALTRATGKPVVIEKVVHSRADRTIKARYRILGTLEKVSRARPRAFEPAGPNLGYLLGPVGLVLAASGLITLAFVGWLTWYDITTWSKGLGLIFFGSRSGEHISLGIGMRVIHYLLVGSALFLSGTLMFFRKRSRT